MTPCMRPFAELPSYPWQQDAGKAPATHQILLHS